MLLKLVELRSSDWGRVRDAVATCNATPDNDPNYFMVSVHWAILPIFLFYLSFFKTKCFKASLFLLVMVFFSCQNEPTFYTEDGIPFTAADPGKAMRTCS